MRLDQRIGGVVSRVTVLSLVGLLLWACGGGGDGPQVGLTTRFVPAQADPGANSISLRQNLQESTADTIALDVVANNVTAGKIFSVAFDLNVAPGPVSLVRYTKGQFFETTSNQVVYLVDLLQNNPNVIVGGISQLAPDPGADGSGVIVTLYFQARNPGDAVLGFQNLELFNPSGSLINLALFAGTIEVR